MEENFQNCPAPRTEGKGSAIASLVLGICAIVFDLIPFLGLALGIVGLVLACDAAKKGFEKGIRTAGLILSIIGLIFSAAFTLFVCALGIFAVRFF